VRADRILGRIRGDHPGPSLIALGGIHGNEAAGVLALQRVVETLNPRSDLLSGEILALVGNRGALARERRFLGRDLNRMWTPERLAALHGRGPVGGLEPERAEQRELLRVLDGALAAAPGNVLFLDLHTTSGPGRPFTTLTDEGLSRRFASTIPVPLVLGLGGMLKGTLAGYLAEQGVPSVVFEGGQHGTPESLALSEAALWVALAGTGMFPEDAVPEIERSRVYLRETSRGLPPLFEMRYRHSISPNNGFRMLPGFKSFQKVAEGLVVAEDRTGPVRVPEEGYLLLPLYQAQGEDGFFVIREPNQMY
jgi:succinylglutamate desuccinylase